MAYSSADRSERLLQSRRFTTDNLTLSQEAFTQVFDLGASEILTDDGLIPTGSTQLPYSGSSQNLAIVSASVVNPLIEEDLPILKYWYRKKIKPAGDGSREVYYFTESDPSAVDDTVTSDQLIETDQLINFVSPKYIIASDSVNTTESTTPGYKVVVYKSTSATAGGVTEQAADPASYVFDFKTGVLTWNDGSAPASNQYVYITTYQYVGRTLRSQLDDGSIQGASTWDGLDGKPAGLVSSSAQTIANLPSGTVSGSSQVDYTAISNVPSGIISGSSQVDYTAISNVPSGLVSGSSQITLGGDLSGTANSATVTKVQGVALTSGEATQLANIGSVTISATQWGYLGAMDQNVRTTDAVAFAQLTINGAVEFNNASDVQSFVFNPDTSVTTIATASVSQNLTVGGDLIVNGDLTYLNTTNTAVEDQFILLGSGSQAADNGIIFDGAIEAIGEGAAFFFDSGVSRLSYATSVSHADTEVTPTAYIPLVFDVTGASHEAVTDVGNIKIEDGEAFIYV